MRDKSELLAFYSAADACYCCVQARYVACGGFWAFPERTVIITLVWEKSERLCFHLGVPHTHTPFVFYENAVLCIFEISNMHGIRYACEFD